MTIHVSRHSGALCVSQSTCMYDDDDDEAVVIVFQVILDLCNVERTVFLVRMYCVVRVFEPSSTAQSGIA